MDAKGTESILFGFRAVYVFDRLSRDLRPSLCETAELLKRLIADVQGNQPSPLFMSRHRKPLTRFGIYYAILGVSRGADAATIHRAFRTLARQYHPDAGRGSSTSKFREALEAYHTLSDPGRRRQHDLDLGKSVEPTKVTAEPLFDPARSRNAFVRPMPVGLDELMKALLHSVESEFEFAFHSWPF